MGLFKKNIHKATNKYWSSGVSSTSTATIQQQYAAMAAGVTGHIGTSPPGHIGTSPQWWVDDHYQGGVEIDPSILAVTSERAERSIRIDFRQITCPCNHISLVRLEYSTDGHDTDDVRFTCPACGQEDKIHLVDIHPDGANIKIIETWQVGSDVKWDNKNVRQHTTQPQGPIEIRVSALSEDHPPYSHERIFSIHCAINEYIIKMHSGNKYCMAEEIAGRLSEHIYRTLMSGVKP